MGVEQNRETLILITVQFILAYFFMSFGYDFFMSLAHSRRDLIFSRSESDTRGMSTPKLISQNHKMKVSTSVAVLLLAQATNASFLKVGGNTFSDGVAAGKKEAEGLWRQQGSDCANV